MNRERHLRIVVAAGTRRRPKMVAALLGSLARMTLPDRTDVTALIVENDDAPRTEPMIDDLRPGFPIALRYVLETAPGIARMRNRALAEADGLGADALAFVDDDEEVAPDWLVNILEAYRRSDHMIIGGPLHHMRPPGPLSPLAEAVFKAAAEEASRQVARRNAFHAEGQNHRITLATHNWLMDLALYRTHDLRFNETLGPSGGEDTAYFTDVWSRGFTTGWAPDAVVTETQPVERLTLRYQFERRRDEMCNTWIERSERRGARRTARKIVRLTLWESPDLIGRLIALPFGTRRAQFELAVRAGIVWGRLRALTRRRSTHYSHDRQTGY